MNCGSPHCATLNRMNPAAVCDGLKTLPGAMRNELPFASSSVEAPAKAVSHQSARKLRIRLLHQPVRAQAAMAGAADDEVVVDSDAQCFSRLDDAARHLDVGLGGCRVAGGVVVDEDDA